MKSVEDPPVKDQAAEISRLKGVIVWCKDILHTLACLGNGEHYGNSLGNHIAQEALAAIKEIDQA